MKIKRKIIPQGTKLLRYSWTQFDRDMYLLIQSMEKSGFKPKSIVCIATGGLCAGAKLRNLLGAPLTILSTASYSGFKQQKTLTLNSSYVVPLQSPVLLVDDIADTGKTLSVVKQHLELGGTQIKTATIFYKESSVIKPDWFVHKVAKNRWIEFAWERENKYVKNS
jgi:hypoxanthine phosphoribosyltransferase